MTFGQFMSIMRARWWLSLLVFALVVGGALGITFLLPKQFTASSSVVIDVKPDPVSVMSGGILASPSFMATQVDILNSDRVTSRVIRELKLAENPQLRQQWLTEAEGRGNFEQYLIGLIERGLEVRPSRESNVITIGYKAPDPRFAAALANAFAQAYIATTLELRADPAQNFKRLFDNQAKEAREAVERAQAKLSAFQQAKGIIATDDRMDVETARLNELSSQFTVLQSISAESTSRQAQAVSAQADRLQEVLNNPLLTGMKADLARAEARLQELSARYGDNHPQVIEAKANIAELQNRLEAETKRVTGGVNVSNNINKSREIQVQKELAAQRAKVLQLKAVRDEGVVLQREVENAQRIYDSMAQRLSQTNIESQNSQSFANILTVAQPPATPSSPRILYNSLMGVFAGAFLALLAALVLEMLDRRVRTPDDVVALVGLPVLGTLPKPGAKRYVAGNRPLLVQTVMAQRLPAPGAAQQGGV